MQRSLKVLALAAVAVMMVAACGSSSSSSGGASGSGKKIALLLPETKTARYESKDKPLFEADVAKLCGAQVLYSNANQDAPTQQNQADAALTNGANVLVLDAVDGAAAATIATKAKTSKVPVVSYDRLILNAPVDYYISFDNAGVGKLQGTALLTALGAKTNPTVVQINGDPPTTTPPSSSRAPTASSTARSTSPRSTTRRRGALTTPRRRCREHW